MPLKKLEAKVIYTYFFHTSPKNENSGFNLAVICQVASNKAMIVDMDYWAKHLFNLHIKLAVSTSYVKLHRKEAGKAKPYVV